MVQTTDMSQAGGSTPSKRPREESQDPEDEDHGGVGEESQISTFSIDEEISCGICLGVLESPYTVIPCLHTFDKDCLVGWWQRNDTCPLCKTRATLGRHSFQLQAIVDHYDSKRPPHKRVRGENAGAGQGEAAKAEIYPFGVAPLAAANQHDHDEDEDEGVDEDHDDDEDQDEDEGEDDGNLLVGGRIVFPCPACRPGHPSGYTCPIPIPEPTDAMKDSETQDYLLGRRAIVEPIRGDRRIPFAEGLHNAPGAEHLFTAELKAEIDRACEEHIACMRCSSYLPRNWPGRARSTCKGCGNATCEAFDQIGCPWGVADRFLTPFNGQAPNLPDCWYGKECRTQSHNAGHAARFNHDCEPRPQGQVQEAPPAPAPAPGQPPDQGQDQVQAAAPPQNLDPDPAPAPAL